VIWIVLAIAIAAWYVAETIRAIWIAIEVSQGIEE